MFRQFQAAEFAHKTWSLPIHLPYAFQFTDLMKALAKFDLRRPQNFSEDDIDEVKEIMNKFFISADVKDERLAWETILVAASDYAFDDKEDTLYIPDVVRTYTVENVRMAVRMLITVVEYIERIQERPGLRNIHKSLFVAQDVLGTYEKRTK